MRKERIKDYKENYHDRIRVLFAPCSHYECYRPGSYSLNPATPLAMKNLPLESETNVQVLWINNHLIDDKYNHPKGIRESELKALSAIGSIAEVEAITEHAMQYPLVHVSAKRRVKIYDIGLDPDGIYRASYEPYDDIPLSFDDQQEALNVIEQIKRLYQKLDVFAFLGFLWNYSIPIHTHPQTLEDYLSKTSLNLISELVSAESGKDFIISKSPLIRLQGFLSKIQIFSELQSAGVKA